MSQVFHSTLLLKRSSLPLQPLHRPLIPLEKPFRLLLHLFVIRINPLPLLPAQQPHINQLPTHGHHSHMLEPQIRLVAKMMPRLHLPAHDDVFDPDAKVAVLVVPGLVRQHVAGRQRHLAVLDPRADADGALVDVEVGADAVAGPVPVVEPFRPQELPGERVEREAGRAFGEDGGVESDDALEDQRVGFPLHGGRGAEVQGPRRVGGAVEVLGARVAEVDGLGVDGGAVAWFGLVVDDGGVRAGGGDGVEGEAGEMVFGSDALFMDQMEFLFSIRRFGDLRSYGFKLVSCLDLVQYCSLFDQLFFQPCKILGQRCSVSNMTGSHPL